MSKSPNALVEDWFERVWNQNDESAVHEMMATDCQAIGLNLPSSGPEAFLGFRRTFGNNFDAVHVEVLESAEQDDRCIGHARFTGQHKDSDKPVEMVFSFSIRCRDGQIIESRNTVDFTTMLVQIDAMDPTILTKAIG